MVPIAVTAPAEELPPPSTDTPVARELFEFAKAHQDFRHAFYRQLRHLLRTGATQEQITDVNRRSASRLLRGLRSLVRATRRHRMKAGPTEALHLMHLEAWLLIRHANIRWEDEVDAEIARDGHAATFQLTDGPAYSPGISLLTKISASPHLYQGRSLAMLQLSNLLSQTGEHEESLRLARKLACPGATQWNAEAYEQCAPGALSDDRKTFVWMELIGRAHFDNAGELPLAAAAFRRAIKAGGVNSELGHYMLAWSHYRQDQFDEAIASFFDLLAIPGEPARLLHKDARNYVAMSLVDQWELAKASPHPLGLVDLVERALSSTRRRVQREAILEQLLQITRDMQLQQETAAIEELLGR